MDEHKDIFSYRCSIFGHTLDVRSVVKLQDSNGGVISGSRDKSVKIWKPVGPSEFNQTHHMIGATHFISSLCVLPPSKEYPSGLVMAGSNDSIIYGFSIETSQLVLKLCGHSNTVCSLAAGHGILVSGSWDKSARIWQGQRCISVMKGHQAAVWAVGIFSDGCTILTGSADKTIKSWRSENCVQVFEGHTDCVRGLAIISSDTFLSCSNDSTIRLWETNGLCIRVFTGHTSYVYDVILIDGITFASCSEDQTVKIWKHDTCVQTLDLPFKTVWSIAILSNGDLAVGGCDGSVRIFTKHKELTAPPEEAAEYAREVAVSLKCSKTSIGDLKLEDVPGLEAIAEPGTEDGQTAMCRVGDTVTVYQWNATLNEWISVGEVTDANDSAKKMFEGKEYDYIFHIEVEEGTFLKLPYNNGENPWSAAQKFIHKHNLSQYFLQQISEFIVANSQTAVTQQEPPVHSNVDPFTGDHRYVPSGAPIPQDFSFGDSRYIASGAPNPQDSLVPGAAGDSQVTAPNEASSVKSDNYYPQKDYIQFHTANLEGLGRKLQEFNEKVETVSKVTDDEIKEVMQLADMPHAITDSQMEILDKIMCWPIEYIFPVLDLFRLAVRCEAMDQRIGQVGSSVVGRYLLKHLDHRNSDANRMLVFRTFSNMLGHPSGESVVVGHFKKICDASLCCLPSSNKNVQIAIATLYLNFAVALNKSLLGDAQLLSENVANIIAVLTESEALFRLFVAIGTLLNHPVSEKLIKQSNISQYLQELLVRKNQQEKVLSCVTCLIKDLS